MAAAPDEIDELRREIGRLAGGRAAALGTWARREGSAPYPFVSLVVPALGEDGRPLLLLSDLSDHARNLAAAPEMSLLFTEAVARAQPLAGPRVTLLGEAHPSVDPRDRAVYLRQRPEAESYAGFGDFRIYRCAIAEAYFVGGFGRIRRLAAAELFGN